MNVLIVEDDMLQRKSLKKMIHQIDKGINIYESCDKDEALEITNIYSIDVFYVDICLNSSSGVDFAMEIRKIPKYEFSFIIFLTTHVEYLTKAFKEVHCYDYILKPYDMSDVVNMTKHFKSHIENINEKNKVKKYIVIEIKRGVNVKIYIDETIFIEVYLRKCMIHTVNGVYKVNNLALSKILKLINSKNIVQCHKSFAVNVNYIKKIENVDNKLSEIYFENYDKNAPLGYKFKNAIMEQFQ
ncbi:LytTR family DNA-binding domain-containing protein [Clostridium frigoris]|uniref:LytTR family DNA-binding domain-containing protein n=1 Tax=Clostridium frigoris TaxID=205327 RepID=A0ABS6BW02_9CLOT|nr:LytTR family DNA-binding domain-containing protein [Clostridium frigoris]MBU3160680.1 LytTR family DNA-binding domain-containing protein [Clostridium frigoris]